jgi:hypothetical protein
VNADVPFLDQQLTPEQTAAWKGITVSMLMEKHRAGIIQGFKVGNKTLRWHPRSVLASEMQRAGMPLELIAASFGGSSHE